MLTFSATKGLFNKRVHFPSLEPTLFLSHTHTEFVIRVKELEGIVVSAHWDRDTILQTVAKCLFCSPLLLQLSSPVVDTSSKAHMSNLLSGKVLPNQFGPSMLTKTLSPRMFPLRLLISCKHYAKLFQSLSNARSRMDFICWSFTPNTHFSLLNNIEQLFLRT